MQNKVFSVAVFYSKILTKEEKNTLFDVLMSFDDNLFNENYCAIDEYDE